MKNEKKAMTKEEFVSKTRGLVFGTFFSIVLFFVGLWIVIGGFKVSKKYIEAVCDAESFLTTSWCGFDLFGVACCCVIIGIVILFYGMYIFIKIWYEDEDLKFLPQF